MFSVNIMARIFIAVLLSFLCPGLGQFYNRDHRKGMVIFTLTVIMVLLPSLWIMRKVTPLLPDPQSGAISQEMVQATAMQTIAENKHFLNLISFLFLGLWAYAITQSYFKAKEITETEKTEKE